MGTQINVSETGEIQKPQIRVFVHLEPFGEFRNDPGGNVEGYELVDIEQIEKYIKWGEVGDWIALKVGNILKENCG